MREYVPFGGSNTSFNPRLIIECAFLRKKGLICNKEEEKRFEGVGLFEKLDVKALISYLLS